MADLKEEFRDLFAPDVSYPYFDHGPTPEFLPQPEAYQPAHAAWLADMALLAYVPTGPERISGTKFDWAYLDGKGWKGTFVDDTLGRAGLSVSHFHRGETQAFVAHDDRRVFVVFRGTEPSRADFLADLEAVAVQEGSWGKVHGGFAGALNLVWSDVETHLDAIAGDKPVWFTGHSLGAALAALAAGRWAEKGGTVGGLYTFGSPGVGDAEFTTAMRDRGVPAFRFVNDQDVVAGINPKGRMNPIGETRHIGSDGQIGPPSDWQILDADAHGPFGALLRTAVGTVFDTLRSLHGGQLGKLPDNVRDHSPRLYAEALWAALPAEG